MRYDIGEQGCRYPVTLIDDQVTELGCKLLGTLSGTVDNCHRQRLDLKFGVTDQSRFNPHEFLDAIPPLIEQLLGVDDDNSRLSPSGDSGQGHYRLAAAGASLEHPEGPRANHLHRLILVRAQLCLKRELMIGEPPTLVHYLRFDTRVLAEFDGPVGKSPRKPQPLRLLLVIVELGFQLLADPPAVASGGDIFWIVNGQ